MRQGARKYNEMKKWALMAYGMTMD